GGLFRAQTSRSRTGAGPAATAPNLIADSVRRVRQERDRTRALDRRLELALMEGARAGDAPRKDLAALGDEALEQLDVLPVDVLELLRAELAALPRADEDLLARPALAAAARGPAASAARTSGASSGPHDSLLSTAAGVPSGAG